MNKFVICILSFICFFATFSQGQQANPPKIEVIAQATPDMIKVRWAPNSPVTWEIANKYGYIIQRITVLRNNNVLPKPEIVTISEEPIKPLPLEKWEKLVKANKYGAIAAQAIYGKTFQLTQNYQSNVVEIANKTKELESRFSLALFAAAQSIEVANAAGLILIDKRAKPNEKYLYRVFTAVPTHVHSVDTGFVYIGLKDYKPLPKPLEVKVESSGNTVALSWNKKYFEDIYISYFVERSEDGINFKSIGEGLPIINTAPENKKEAERMFVIDTIAITGKKYFYRIKGTTFFGENGPASDTAMVLTGKYISETPSIVAGEVLKDNFVKISWEFSPYLNAEIKGFKVERAEKANGIYEPISKNIILPTNRSFSDGTPSSANYYKITALGKNGKQFVSFPYLVMLEDSVPPSAPTMLTAVADTHGRVVLQWKQNKEKDILGYKVYRANYLNEEFSLVTTSPLVDTLLVDTIFVKTITKNIYYKVVALDKRYNPSDFSLPCVLKRPDLIPPVAPTIKEILASEEGIMIRWNNSTSNDIDKHQLLRKEELRQKWEVVKEFSLKDKTSQYLDKNIASAQYYEYSVKAIDESGLSTHSPVIKTQKITSGIKPEVRMIEAKADRVNRQIVLSWKQPSETLEKVLVYRAREGEEITLYKTVTPGQAEFKDKALTINTIYKYRIKLIYKDGTHSPFSKEIEINY